MMSSQTFVSVSSLAIQTHLRDADGWPQPLATDQIRTKSIWRDRACARCHQVIDKKDAEVRSLCQPCLDQLAERAREAIPLGLAGYEHLESGWEPAVGDVGTVLEKHKFYYSDVQLAGLYAKLDRRQIVSRAGKFACIDDRIRSVLNDIEDHLREHGPLRDKYNRRKPKRFRPPTEGDVS